MDAPPPQSSAAAAARSGSSAAYTAEIAESLRFEEEIQSLMRDNTLIHPSLDPAPPPPPPPPPSSSSAASSFTALLGLSPNQAVELLHDSIGGASASTAASPAAAADPWPRLGLPLPRASPTFPSNAELVDRAARFSVFAAAAAAAAAAASDSSSPASSSGDPSPAAPPPPPPPPPPRRPSPAPKRKDPPTSSAADKSKAKAKTKRSSGGDGGGGGGVRSAEEDTGGFEKLPYVHVRARRGQATDSHSLAERARREKINARMKLLQELVPGCSKISGTALVLDEIINHVQSLQRQVEFLSMRLAAVNPRVDFGGLNSFLSAECGRIAEDNGNGKNGAEEEGQRAAWTDGGSDGVRRPQHHHHHHHHQQQQIWHVDLAHPHHAPSTWERGPGDAHDPHLFINPSSGGVASLYAYDPSSASAPLQSNQLKTEL